MKKTILSFGLVAFIMLSAFVSKKNTKKININSKLSKVEWIGKQVTGQHHGTIAIKEGSFEINENRLLGGKITIDMESIVCENLEGEMNQKLVGHLSSPDFFDVANHKTSYLEIKSVKQKEGNKFDVTGDLTIKDITKLILFPATIEIKDGKLAAYSEIEIDRTLYDIKYGSGKFFEGLGDKMINDNFIIKFRIAAK